MASLLEVVGPRDGAAPLTYTLTESGTVDLQSVFASFDGAGASGDWRATVTIRSQNGTILARVFPSTTLAAGDTADVTYAPFLDGSPAPTTTTQPFAAVLARNFAIPAGFYFTLGGAGATPTVDALSAGYEVDADGRIYVPRVESVFQVSFTMTLTPDVPLAFPDAPSIRVNGLIPAALSTPFYAGEDRERTLLLTAIAPTQRAAANTLANSTFPSSGDPAWVVELLLNIPFDAFCTYANLSLNRLGDLP